MANRNTWKFEFEVKDVLSGCQQRIKFHEDRLVFWGKLRDDAEAKIESSSVVIAGKRNYQGSQQTRGITPASVSYTPSNRVQPHILAKIDPEVQKQYSDACMKIDYHEDKLRAYRDWEKVLTGSKTLGLALDFDDYMFFNVGDRTDDPEAEE